MKMLPSLIDLTMDKIQLELLPVTLLNAYKQGVSKTISADFDQLRDSVLSVDTFSFYTSVSAVFSSKIEGESIEIDSFIKHKLMNVKILPDHTQKIDDLYDAYLFAQKSALNEATLKKAHQILTKHLLQKVQRGKIRSNNIFVMTPGGKIEYVACLPQQVKTEMTKLYADIMVLLQTRLDFAETFFFASMIYLVFVKIHPFNDGNGRTARLLEKWFLAQKLGEKAWYFQSEKYYYNHYQTYYSNIRQMGLEYQTLDYAQAMPFLLMLAEALSV